MRARFERSRSGAVLPLATLFAALMISEASPDGLQPSAPRDPSGRAQACSGDQGCVRIRGYIAAGSDFTETAGDIPAPFAPLPQQADGAAHDPADPANRGMLFLPASGDDNAR